MVTAVHHLVGAQEIGHMLGVSRQRVQQLIARADWPRPEADLAMGKVWRAEDIRTWATGHGREIRELPERPPRSPV